MALDNTSFETADPGNPGLADAWTLTVVAAVTIAGFDVGGGLEQAWEGFELGWDADDYAFAIGNSITTAQFSSDLFVTPLAYEGFDAGWPFSQAFNTDLGATVAAEFNSTLDPFEGFDFEWGVTSFETTLPVSLTSAGVETFDSGWLASPYSTSLGAYTNASFDGPPYEAFEDFDQVIAPVPFTVDPATDVCTAVGHPFTNGMRVRIASTGQPPGGLSTAVDWYVVGATANTFQLSATVGGGAQDIEHQGGGVHTILADPDLYWTEVLT